MPRQARIVVPGEPHHVTQRGNRRQTTFFCEADYRSYLRLAAEIFPAAGVEIWAYCLMPNHVHLIAAPATSEALAAAMGALHVRYTRRINERQEWTGCLWQGRFSSFPMDESHLINCARYVGMNPVRSGLVKAAQDWPWSSVRAHLFGLPDPLLTSEPLASRLDGQFADLFDADVGHDALAEIRRASVNGMPLGAAAWIKSLELASGRDLIGRPRGRPRRTENGDRHNLSVPPRAAATLGLR